MATEMATRSQKNQTLVLIGGQGNPQRQSYTRKYEVCMEHLRSVLLAGKDKPRADDSRGPLSSNREKIHKCVALAVVFLLYKSALNCW
jgi:hypothetical protein